MNLRLLFSVLLCSLTAHCAAAIVPDMPVMNLDEVGIYDVAYALRDGGWHAFPAGWSGYFDEQIGIACQPVVEQNGRRAFLLHPPWRDGAGTVYQQFTFQLPKAPRAILRGATAMRSDVVGKSDGVTFRVYVNGQRLLDATRTDSDWRAFEFDLTPFAGKTVAIRFETDSGPKNDAGWDFALWGDRQLVLEGYEPEPITHNDPPPLDVSRVLSRPGYGPAAPPDGFGGKTTVSSCEDSVTFRYTGRDGALAYRWTPPTKTGDPILGRIELVARMTGDAEVTVPLAGGSRIEFGGQSELISGYLFSRASRTAWSGLYKSGGKHCTVTLLPRMIGKSLVIDVQCTTPMARVLDAGAWGPVLRRRSVAVPYYSGQVSYLPRENLFVNSYLDWTCSNASSHDGTRACYGQLTDGSLNLLCERVVFSAAWHLAEVLPGIHNKPSPFIRRVGDKIVLDTWGGRYTDIAENLEKLYDYGIRNCIVLVHVWQRSGYDNALPMHIPADASLGGDEGMKTLVETGKRLGYIMALHENYADYYPNYDHYTESDIALDSDGELIKAWYNAGTKIQSFAVKPNAILPLARAQSPEIHKRYGTNGCYLDVHSAVPPWFHVDFRAGENGAGESERVWEVHRQLWDYERRTHGGPVFGEGNNHWYWSGCLDGVEAQFGSGWPGQEGETAPLAVDFDLTRIHPLQVNHGMGYYERWSRRTGWGDQPPMIALDQYRMQELIYGHAGFLGARNWNDLPQAWLEHHLVTPVTARYASAKPSEISYQVNGKWVDGSAAAKAGSWKRARVRYDSGLTITANDSNQPLRAGDYTLPRFGWLAEGAGVTAYTALRDGVIVDYAETEGTIFANARDASVWNQLSVRDVRPSIAAVEQTAPREFRITYEWSVTGPISADYRCFVHFTAQSTVDSSQAIYFQDDHALPSSTSTWKTGDTLHDGPHTVRIPDEVEDGDYSVRVGLFSSAGREAILGKPDGEARIITGTLHVRDGGKSITFQPEKPYANDNVALYSQRLNAGAKVIDFGPLRTNGSVLIRRDGDDWVLQTLPRDRSFTLELDPRLFGAPSELASPGGATGTVHTASRDGWLSVPLNGAREYRWPR